MDGGLSAIRPSREERLKELRWFQESTEDLRGLTVHSVAENIESHFYESRVLSRAFEDITGIRVIHRIIPEGDLVPLVVDQIENNVRHYDIFVNDAELIGCHLRTKAVVNLTEYMGGEGKKYTNPYLDLEDFLNLEFGQDYDGNQLQLADEQFVNLYWFRYDWFTREDIQKQFKAMYGFELGFPINWAAYEDIAEFFTSTKIDWKAGGSLALGAILRFKDSGAEKIPHRWDPGAQIHRLFRFPHLAYG
jgi:glycerol transport system substrate-binding protein